MSDLDLLDSAPVADESKILEGLNDSQKEAVSAPLCNALIIAGAGTGKTRVLVSRIVYLISHYRVKARNILAVTFTNKAAKEMRERIGMYLNPNDTHHLWANTFHSTCLRLLRAYATQAGLTPGFLILDTDGQNSLVKRIMQDLQIDIKEIKPSEFASRISSLKEKGIRADDFHKRINYIKNTNKKSSDTAEKLALVYTAYERICNQENSVDFAEILLRTVELLRTNTAIREIQNERFREILVDEFQDTNSIQYELLTLLAGKDSHVMVVGDDDQSIYSWRGADYTNMKKFLKTFPDVHQYLLSLNYRSTQNILDMANTLIEKNFERVMLKNLKGNNGTGSQVSIFKCANNRVEELSVAKEIQSLKDQGVKLSDIAVLYRNNYLSFGFEQALTKAKIPYVIYGGQKFFDRAEIQSALAYLKILVNKKDDTALLRIINLPARKIGPKVVESLRNISNEHSCSIIEAIEYLHEYVSSSEASKELKTLYSKVSAFYNLYIDLISKKETMRLHEFVHHMLTVTGLYTFYSEKDAKEGKSEEDNSRYKNLGVLVSNVKEFEASVEQGEVSVDSENEVESEDLLTLYLTNITLVSGGEINENGSDEAMPFECVNLMTIHASKGLEFKYVFICGFESDILPSSRKSSSGDSSLEEERRLAYVGITRAKEQLVISYAKSRTMFGKNELKGASSFLYDIVGSYENSDNKPYKIVAKI